MLYKAIITRNAGEPDFDESVYNEIPELTKELAGLSVSYKSSSFKGKELTIELSGPVPNEKITEKMSHLGNVGYSFDV